MAYITSILGLLLFLGFWIGAFVNLTKVENGIGYWIANFLGSIFVSGLVAIAFQPTNTGWAGLGQALFAIGAGLVIFFIWGIVVFVKSIQKKSKVAKSRPIGSEDLLDDI